MKEWSVVVKVRVKEEKEVQRWWGWMNIFSGGKGNMIPLLELRKQRICKTTITLSFCFRKDIKEKLGITEEDEGWNIVCQKTLELLLEVFQKQFPTLDAKLAKM